MSCLVLILTTLNRDDEPTGVFLTLKCSHECKPCLLNCPVLDGLCFLSPFQFQIPFSSLFCTVYQNQLISTGSFYITYKANIKLFSYLKKHWKCGATLIIKLGVILNRRENLLMQFTIACTTSLAKALFKVSRRAPGVS